MKPEGLSVYEEVNKKPELIYDINSEANMNVPDDLIEAFRKNTVAHNNFINFHHPAVNYIYSGSTMQKGQKREMENCKNRRSFRKEYPSRNDVGNGS